MSTVCPICESPSFIEKGVKNRLGLCALHLIERHQQDCDYLAGQFVEKKKQLDAAILTIEELKKLEVTGIRLNLSSAWKSLSEHTIQKFGVTVGDTVQVQLYKDSIKGIVLGFGVYFHNPVVKIRIIETGKNSVYKIGDIFLFGWMETYNQFVYDVVVVQKAKAVMPVAPSESAMKISKDGEKE